MPRSLPPNSPEPSGSSSSSSSSSRRSSQDSPATRAEKAAARERAAEAQRAPTGEPAGLVHQATGGVAVRTCTRQVAGQLSSFRRRSQGHPAEHIVDLARPTLVGPTAQGLQSDVDRVMAMLGQKLPQNDYTWLFFGPVGRLGDPTKQHIQQQLQLLLARDMEGTLCTHDLARFVQQAVVYAAFGFYVECIWLVWHLFSDHARYAFQSWYHGVPRLEPQAPGDPASQLALPMELEREEREPTDADVPEPARGSRDPPPSS